MAPSTNPSRASTHWSKFTSEICSSRSWNSRRLISKNEELVDIALVNYENQFEKFEKLLKFFENYFKSEHNYSLIELVSMESSMILNESINARLMVLVLFELTIIYKLLIEREDEYIVMFEVRS